MSAEIGGHLYRVGWGPELELSQDFPYWESSGSMGSPNEMMA